MKWNNGVPPAIGWWPASNSRNPDAWRWWDGYAWSYAAMKRFDSERAAEEAAHHADDQRFVEWRHWPKAMRHLPGYPLSIHSQGTEP